MIATSGAQLLPEAAVKTLLKELLPLTTVLTPNLPEALLLLKEAGIPFENPKFTEDLVRMAKTLQQLGPEYVLLKGGHLPLTKDGKISESEADHHTVFNILVTTDAVHIVANDYQRSKNTHGTGCSLACKLASLL
jgi:hydroxymethylpyrimidine kinase/phosphomethylpyrimidine kinase